MTEPETTETSMYRPVVEGPGARIGFYKLLQQIGEGGFGVVYMAEQLEPVRRKVALKIIKPGMDTKEVVARFESERQALALMDHPNIARVLDAGATESGRPFFVMELVRGVPITEYCDKNNVSTEKRLELFVTICHAVQHAHQKGVIHRDLKPSNVMVTLHDGHAVPKVIDFGVAKATTQHLTERTLFTAYGQMIGTPAYMSPEQAEMSGLDIDTRSDIYSLGVLLYELLTGSTPFDIKRLRDAGYVEMQRIIREEDPPSPSTRVSTLGASLTVISTHRSTDPTKLRQLLRGDLDLIVMKSLEKERTRRYETANSFADDVERFLRHEAIQARRQSTVYRLRKFAQRNKIAVLTGSAVAGCLIIGTIVSSLLAVQAVQQRNRAHENLTTADRERKAAETSRVEAERQRNVAQLASAAEAAQRKLAEEQRSEAEKARQAEAELRAAADQRRIDIERQNVEIAALNNKLAGLAEEQRRTIYTANLNLIPKAWESDNLARVLDLLEGQRPLPGQKDLRGFEWRYWNRLCHSELRTVKVHQALERELPASFAGRTFEFSPDGSRIAALLQTRKAGRVINALNIWDSQSGNELYSATLPADDPALTAAIATENQRGIMAGFGSSAFYLWAPSIFFVGNERVAVVRREFQLSGNVVMPHHSELTVHDLSNRKVAYALRESSVSFFANRDGSRIGAVVLGDQETLAVKLWDGRTGEPAATVPLPKGIWQLVAITNDAMRLAVAPWMLDTAAFAKAGAVPQIKILEIPSGKVVATIDQVFPASLEFSPDGARLVTLTSGPGIDNESATISARMYEASSGKKLWSLALPNPISAVWCKPLFSPDNRWIAFVRHPSLPNESSLRLYDAPSGISGPIFKGHTTPIIGAAFNVDGTQVHAAANDGTLKTWLEGKQHSSPSMASGWTSGRLSDFSPNGARIASIVGNRSAAANATPQKLSVSEFATQAPIWNRDIPGPAEQLVYSLDGQYVAASYSTSDDQKTVVQGHVGVWKADTGELVLSFDCPPSMRHSAVTTIEDAMAASALRLAPDFAFSPDSLRLAITAELKPGPEHAWTIKIFELASGRELVSGEPLAGAGVKPQFSGDGKHLLTQATAGSETAKANQAASSAAPQAKAIKIWSAETGKVLWGLNAVPSGMQFSADGTRLCGHLGSDAIVWDAMTGAEVVRLPQIELPPKLALSPDGRRLVLAKSSSYNPFDRRPGVVMVWDLGTNKELFQLAGHSSVVTSIAFTPDGQRIATTAGTNAETKVWDAQTGHELLALPGVQTGLRFSLDGTVLTGLSQPPFGDAMVQFIETRRLVLADASPPNAALEAPHLIEVLAAQRSSNRPRTRQEIWQAIEADRSLSADTRTKAMELAKSLRRPPQPLYEAAWIIAKSPEESIEEYQQAVSLTEEVCDSEPENVDFWLARGVAHYRARGWAAARIALEKSSSLRKAGKRPPAPEEIFFLAMTNRQLGEAKLAEQLLTEARDLVNHSGSIRLSEWRRFLAEAEVVLGLRPAVVAKKENVNIPGWGEVIDPLGDCQVTAAENELSIRIPGTLHSLAPANSNFDAPRVLRQVLDDFTAQVKVTCSIEPQSTLTDRGIAYIGAGLLVWEGAENHVRVERNGYFLYPNRPLGSPPPQDLPPPKIASHFPLVECIRGGKHVTAGRDVWDASTPMLPGPSTWLRVQRKGMTMHIALSHDGQTWQDVAPVETALPASLSVGVVARNNTGSPFEAEFSEFTLTQP